MLIIACSFADNKTMIRPINYMENKPQENKDIVWGYNELIAHYMGYKYYPFRENEDQATLNREEYACGAGWKIHQKVSAMSKFNAKDSDYLCRSVRDMAYHYDWNWLMSVVHELLVRHGFYVYLIGGVACSLYKEDLEVPLSVANGGPKHFHVEYTAQNQEQMVMVMWQCVAETVQHILTNFDPKIPVIEEYKGRLDWSKDSDLDDLPGRSSE